MSVTEFRPFATVKVEEKGTGVAIGALAFQPTAATARKLADQRLLFRPRPAGFQLYAQYNLEAGAVRLGATTRRTPLIFAIRLADPALLARYHPELDEASGRSLYLANLDNDGTPRASGELSRGASVEKADAARIVGRRLQVRADMEATPKPQSLKVRDRYAPGRTVADVPVVADAGATSAAVPINLSADLAHAFTIAPQPADDPKAVLFADDELAGRGAFGVLELVTGPFPGPEPAGGRAYTATFRRRS